LGFWFCVWIRFWVRLCLFFTIHTIKKQEIFLCFFFISIFSCFHSREKGNEHRKEKKKCIHGAHSIIHQGFLISRRLHLEPEI
jgi:hypothetical protein